MFWKLGCRSVSAIVLVLSVRLPFHPEHRLPVQVKWHTFVTGVGLVRGVSQQVGAAVQQGKTSISRVHCVTECSWSQSGLCFFAQRSLCVVCLHGCPTLSNPVPWQNWMAAYLSYTPRMKTLFRSWPVMVHDTHTRRRRDYEVVYPIPVTCNKITVTSVFARGRVWRSEGHVLLGLAREFFLFVCCSRSARSKHVFLNIFGCSV